MVDKYKKPSFYVLSFMIGLGLGLIAVGIFTGVATSVSSEIPDVSGTISLFDKDFSEFGISNTFAVLSFILTVIGALILTAEISLRVKSHKYIRPLHIAGIAITAVGAILILVSGMLIAKDIKDALIEYALAMSGASSIEGAILDMLIDVKAGPGVWLGFIGGLIAAIASGVSMLKRFMPDPPAPATPVGGETATPAQPAPETPAQNEAPEAPANEQNNDLI